MKKELLTGTAKLAGLSPLWVDAVEKGLVILSQ
jgi:hypothetical protein